MPSMSEDPWAQVEDLDGRDKYRTLKVSYRASPEEIKKAYRDLARKHHPDKGGDAEVFSRIQEAFETLSSNSARAVYDEWAKETQFRYVRGVASRAQGGEGILLEELEELGLHCDPLTQLVVTCEVCRRPSTKQCWTCGMDICSFCTLKRHWKEGFPLHWPLINSSHMETQLAKRELEKKRVEDAKRLEREDPNFRNEGQLKDIRDFKDVAYRMRDCKDRLVRYDLGLARFYMWAQTDNFIYIAVNVPTGYEDRELTVCCTEFGLKVQPEESPPIIERAFNDPVDTTQPIDTFRTADNRTLVVVIVKRGKGQRWRRLFRGDSDGARCLEPPYRLSESEDDVVVEVNLPHWIDTEDITVDITEDTLGVHVHNTLSFQRSYWRPRDQRQGGQRVMVDVAESLWSLDESEDEAGKETRTLLINLVKPPLTDDEVTWKKGKRQDNRNATRSGSMMKGFRFFEDDEDEYGLEDILQALCYLESGQTFVPAKPWRQGVPSKWVVDVQLLDAEVQKHLTMLLDEEDKSIGL